MIDKPGVTKVSHPLADPLARLQHDVAREFDITREGARQTDPPEEEYLSIRALAQRIPYAEQTIRNLMSRGVFRLGEHYVKPRGRVMFRWSAVQAWLEGRPSCP